MDKDGKESSTTFKLIKFIKSSNAETKELSNSTENLYQDLPPANKSPKPEKQPQIIQNICQKSQPTTLSLSIDPNKHNLFKAIHQNDLSYLKVYLNNGFDPFVEDDFKWNVLMVAVASKSNDILAYFLENVADKKRVLQLLESKDAGGNTAENLSKRFSNQKAIEIINEFKSSLARPEVKNEPTYEIVEDTTSEEEEVKYWCEKCNKEFNQTESEHIKSIIHQLSETERPLSETSGRYHLRSDNKGYQLLVKSGWNETSGLGVNEQGVKNPIRGKVKLNRKGIGVPNDDKKFQNLSLKSLKLKKNGSESGQTSDGALLREFKRSKHKYKVKERNLRRYFDS